MISNPYRLVLFYRAGEALSDYAYGELEIARDWLDDDKGTCAAMDIRYCNAVCVAHDINCSPCCLIFDRDQNVLKRECHPMHLNRLWFHEMLEEILDASSV